MTVYALTLSWNGSNNLKALYPSLKSSAEKSNIDLYWLIRDNASEDDTEQTISKWQETDINLLYYKANNNNDSFAKCNNFLVDKVKENFKINLNEDYFLLLNNDIVINDPFSLYKMMDLFKKPNVGVVGARLFYPNSKLIQHAGVAFSQKHGNMPWHIFSKEQDSQFTNQNREFQAVTGAFMIVRASAWLEQPKGLMDERFLWAFDDISTCLNISLVQKRRVLYCGQTGISHYESFSLDQNKYNKKYMKHNVDLFRRVWGRKYTLDYYDYINNPNHNIVK